MTPVGGWCRTALTSSMFALSAWTALSVAGCGDSSKRMEDGGTAEDSSMVTDTSAIPCGSAAQCDDGLFCNGTEMCSAGFCAPGEAPDCDDGIECTRDVCSEMRRECRNIVPDADGDGVGDAACVDASATRLGRDCDDHDASRFPGNEELCDADHKDEDCDPMTFGSVDLDGDGFRSAACCNIADDGTRYCGDDCDDVRIQVNPMATEPCDGFDNDCDGRVDESVLAMIYVDNDRDGHGDPDSGTMGCTQLSGYSSLDDDCDDTLATRHRAQLEFCDQVDNDCDGRVDENAEAVEWYPDLDGDGFGDANAQPVQSCVPVADHSLLDTDCDDTNASRNPAAPELCNGRDDNCSGAADFSLGVNNTEDDDQDGLADIACGAPSGVDCDDANPQTGAGEIERCDGRDNDCDSKVDEGATSVVWYLDADGDSYGSVSSGAMISCTPVPGYVRRAGDCDDNDRSRAPSAMESCDGRDDDCDGTTDEAPASLMCSLANAVASCLGGSCGIAQCNSGFADCNGVRSDGCERPLDTVSDCGSCGHVCSGPGASWSCTAGECRIGSCMTGRADCNAFTGDGCETHLTRDPDNCGACGTTCTAPRARTACGANGCVIESCDAGYADCDGMFANGCEQSLVSAQHCGACDAACSTTCEAPGICRAALDCQHLFLRDCDGVASNGCETNLLTSLNHCGGCGVQCGVGAQTCDEGTCDPIDEVATGETFTCARRQSGTVICWGANDIGQIGDGTTSPRLAPTTTVLLPGLAHRITAGANHACALLNSGTVYCWGSNSNGQLGTTSVAIGGTARAPVQVETATNLQLPVVDVRAGGLHTCLLDSSAQVFCWGDNSVGAVGFSPVGDNIATPTQVEGFEAFGPSTLSTGLGFSCFADGTAAWCWGANDLGQLGQGQAGPAQAFPVFLTMPGVRSQIIDMNAGTNHVCALLSGTPAAACWGDNSLGQLATGDLVPIGPALSAFSTPAHSIGGGARHTCFVDTLDHLQCYGSNARGQMGNGLSSAAPVLTATTPSTTLRVEQVSRGPAANHTCVVDRHATVYCWGANDAGQIGNGASGGSVLTPTAVMIR